MTSEKQAQDKTRRVRMRARAASPARTSSLSDEAILPRPIPHRAVAHALHSTALQVPPSQPIQARKDASSFGVLVLIGVAAAFRATFLPHMTKPSVASKLAEANHPVAVPPQWLPVLLAANTPVPPINHRRLVFETIETTEDLREAAVNYTNNATAAETTYGPIFSWDVSAITDMTNIFRGLTTFNADISGWETNQVTNMKRMFQVHALAQPPAEPFPACR
jgi:surface protein